MSENDVEGATLNQDDIPMDYSFEDDNENFDIDNGSDIENLDIRPSDDESPDSDSDDTDTETPDWNDELQDIDLHPFIQETGPCHELDDQADELDFFKLYFPDEALDLLVTETNKYAAQSQQKAEKTDHHWIDTTRDEISAFIGMLLFMGLMNASDVSLYWSTNKYIGNTGFKDVMPKNRYNKLVQYLHANDNETSAPEDNPDFDQLHKIRPLIDIVQNRFGDHYRPKEHQSVDEGMMAYNGRFGPKQYMPSKPTKWGIKVWMRCDSQSGFCHQFDVYLGKSRRQSTKGMPQLVVENLTKSLRKQFFQVYFDSYFTSLRLVKSLLRHGIYACGTIRKNRVGYPREFQETGRLPTGESLARQDGNLVATVWQDKKIVATPSTNASPLQSDVASRRQKDGSLKLLTRPMAVKLYQQHFRGVDICDQLRAAYTCSVGRPSKKWWKYILHFIINVCVINAFITKQESNLRPQKKSYKHLDFRTNLASQLIGGFVFSNKKRKTRPVVLRAAANRDVQGHTLERLTRKRSFCKRCRLGVGKRRKDTVFGCIQCTLV